jgi:Kdo2-lipid IVA lauroyltransferase/acyltransferase
LDSYLIYIVARLVIAFFRLLPRSIGTALIRIAASWVYYLDLHHKKIADINLRIAFPDMALNQRKRIARKSFQNAAMNLIEVSRMKTLTPDTISSLVTYDDVNGLKNYQSALSKGKGILYLTGHFSSWELLPAAHALHGYPLSFITRPLDNTRLERYLLNIRESKGNEVIYKRNSARHILKNLKSEKSTGILMDQNTRSREEGIFVNFFGIPAATTTSVALIALRTQAPVLPGYLTPLHSGRYKIKFLPPIDMIHTGDMDHDVRVNTQRFNDILEQIIREQPESWLWGHKRWNNQPEGNPQDLYNLSPHQLYEFLRKARGES